MGGKGKILNPKQLEALYVENHKFNRVANDCMEVINAELAKLNDTSFQSSLSGGQGEAAKAAIKDVSKAIEALTVTLKKTSGFIDKKLTDAGIVARDKHGFADLGDKAKSAGANMQLRK